MIFDVVCVKAVEYSIENCAIGNQNVDSETCISCKPGYKQVDDTTCTYIENCLGTDWLGKCS